MASTPTPQLDREPLRDRGHWGTMSADARAALLDRGTHTIFDPALRESIVEILEDVRANGDTAVVGALARFDHVEVEASALRVTDEEFRAARDWVSADLLQAIRHSIAQVRRFNEQLMKQGTWQFESAPGVTVGEKATPIASVGLFVPSGKGSYPSVLVQLGTPAVVAGVTDIVVVVPPVPGTDGAVDPAVLVVAEELGIREVFRSNGPAGIAAMAFGTESIPKVLKICGPGSPPVTAAQVEVQRYGTSSVMLLGPTESLILADDSADVPLLAADLLNEAEHGDDSSSVLVTDSEQLVTLVRAEIARQAADLPPERAAYAYSALGVNGGAVLVDDLVQGAEVANAYAPEHLQLVARNEDEILSLLVNAGEILLGQSTLFSAGNYAIGCPASLPTSGYARTTSGITADTFRKRSAVARLTPEGLASLADTITAMADHEGFPAHAAAVRRRLG
ncbi:histidinol dehydrogenase [Homoserinimonas sp. OAct 916]|uniref:histidinol dehydrogenase n=1 Tax=Homoserinimonas sp. OAct 916 TaxID=2211450 RepID=UPI000DBE828D|nr:histidinol dehydrogenase [Homoserinimonas sp. OAct 916]